MSGDRWIRTFGDLATAERARIVMAETFGAFGADPFVVDNRGDGLYGLHVASTVQIDPCDLPYLRGFALAWERFGGAS